MAWETGKVRTAYAASRGLLDWMAENKRPGWLTLPRVVNTVEILRHSKRKLQALGYENLR